MHDNSRRNCEGYSDPTAYATLKKYDEDEEERFHKLLHMLFDIVELSGFELGNRVVLRDKKTGRMWK